MFDPTRSEIERQRREPDLLPLLPLYKTAKVQRACLPGRTLYSRSLILPNVAIEIYFENKFQMNSIFPPIGNLHFLHVVKPDIPLAKSDSQVLQRSSSQVKIENSLRIDN